LRYDVDEPVVQRWQKRLERINEVNSQFSITYQPFDEWTKQFSGERRLRPVHAVIFSGDFQHHGRIYSIGRHGHQGLPKVERHTIRFDGETSVELDFAAFHVRMLYHLQGLDCQGDPYALWDRTTPPMRLLAKKLINTLINAKSPEAAVSACNQCTNSRHEDGQPKHGKDWRDARDLYAAKREAGLEFSAILPLARARHQKIAHRFGPGTGLKLMNLDGQLALAILSHFARRGVPCLSVHDSFIVPAHVQAELKAVMLGRYQKELGFLPVVHG
jgi:hypothetical protein